MHFSYQKIVPQQLISALHDLSLIHHEDLDHAPHHAVGDCDTALVQSSAAVPSVS